MANSTNAIPTRDALFGLQVEVTEFASRHLASEPADAACDWAHKFSSLGLELKRHGYARQLMAVTIGMPSDNAAIDVLRLACAAESTSEVAEVFHNLTARLEVILSVDTKERDRFIVSLKNVLRRLTIFHC